MEKSRQLADAKRLAGLPVERKPPAKREPRPKLTRKQERLVEALADPRNETFTEAAKRAGVNRTAAQRMRHKAAVEAAIEARKRERLDKATSLRAVGERLLRDGISHTDTEGLDAASKIQLGGSLLRLVADVSDKLGDSLDGDSNTDVEVIAAQSRRLVQAIMLASLRCYRDRPDKARLILARLEASLPPTDTTDAGR